MIYEDCPKCRTSDQNMGFANSVEKRPPGAQTASNPTNSQKKIAIGETQVESLNQKNQIVAFVSHFEFKTQDNTIKSALFLTTMKTPMEVAQTCLVVFVDNKWNTIGGDRIQIEVVRSTACIYFRTKMTDDAGCRETKASHLASLGVRVFASLSTSLPSM